MAHAIEVHLSANVEKFNQGMAAAKKTSSDSVGFIAGIFNTVKSYFAGMWDSVKSFFSKIGDNAGAAWGSFKDAASGAFEKVLSMLPGVGKAAEDAGDKMEESGEKADGWIMKIGKGVVVAVTAAIAALAALTAKGLLVDAAFAKISIATDVGAGSLSKFEDAAKRSGMSVADLGSSMKTFQAAMKEAADGSGGKIFKDLGVSVKNSNNELLATGPTLIDFAKHVAAMSSEAEKYGAAAKAGFSVQFLEDIAHANALVSGTTDDQAAKVVQLGKVWHEILPGGKSMWDEISESLSNKLTPALVVASTSILESKNKIVAAFGEIFAGGSMFDQMGNKLKVWADDMAGYFASVVKYATDATISLTEFIAKKTGLGVGMKAAPSAGYIPEQTPLASQQTQVITSPEIQKQIDAYNAASSAIAIKNAITKEEIATGKSLSDGRRQEIELAESVRLGTVKMTLAQFTNRQEELKGAAALQDAAAASKQSQADADALAKKQAQNYASITAAIQSKIAQDELELATGNAVTDGQKLAIKIQKDLEASKRTLTAAQIVETQAQLAALDAVEKRLLQGRAQKEINNYIEEGSIARVASRNALEAEYEAYGKSADTLGLLMVAVNAETDMQKELDKLRKAGLPISGETIKQLEAERDARTAAGKATVSQSNALQYANQLKDANKLYAAQSISDPQASAAAVLKIETDVWQQRIANTKAGTQAQKDLQTEYNTWLLHATTSSVAGASLVQAQLLLDVFDQIDASAQSAAQGMSNSFGQVGAAIGSLTTALSGYGRTQAAIAVQLQQATVNAAGDPVKIERAKGVAAQQAAQAQVHAYGDMAGAAKGFFKENSLGYKTMAAAEKGFRAYEMAMAVQSMLEKSGLLTAFTALFVGSKATEAAVETTATATSAANAGVQASAWGITAVVKAIASMPYPWNLVAGATTLAAVVAVGASMMGGIGGGASAPSISEQRQASQGAGSVLGDSSAKSESIANSLDILEKNSGSDLNYTRGMLAALRAIQTSIGGLGSQLVQSGLTGAYTDVASTGFFAKLGNSIFGGDTTVTDKGITANKVTLSGALSGAWSAKQYTDTKTDGGWFHSDKNNTSTTGLGAAADMQFAKVIQNLAGGITEAAKLLGAGGDAFTQRLNSFVIDIGKVSLKGMTGDEIQKALEAVFSKLGDDMAQFAVGGLAQFQQVGEGYLETLTRVATNYATLDASLQSIGMTFGATGIASIAAREDLISMAGGISNLSDKMSSFSDHFLTEAEQLAPITKYVTEQMAALGYASVDTRDEFKALVLSLNPADQASRTLFNSLLDLESAFDKAHAAGADLTKSESEIASERGDLQKQIDQLTLTTAQQRAKERLGISAVNLAMFDMITNLQTIADTSSMLKTSIDSLKAFRDGILSFKDSLTLGSLSTLTPMQKAIEAQRQYQDMLAKAKAGDTTAQSGIQAAATAYLTANQVINASSSAYVAASAGVQSDLAALAAIAGTQLTDAQLQLAAYDKQLTELSALNTTASNIEAALTMPAPTMNWSEVGTVNMAPLTEEIKGLRADNAELKAALVAVIGNQTAAVNKQTDAVVSATLTAGENNAEAVTEGAVRTAAAASWKQQMIIEAAQ